MTLIVGINQSGISYLFAETAVTTVGSTTSFNPVRACKLGRLCEGINFAICGNADAAYSYLESLKQTIEGIPNLADRFFQVEQFSKIIERIPSFSAEQHFAVAFTSRHSGNASQLYVAELGRPLSELKNTGGLLGSGAPIMQNEITKLWDQFLENQVPTEYWGSVFSAYLDQWCIGKNYSEGHKNYFGGRFVNIRQNAHSELRQPTILTFVVNKFNETMYLHFYSHRWLHGALILRDGDENKTTILTNKIDFESGTKFGGLSDQAVFDIVKQEADPFVAHGYSVISGITGSGSMCYSPLVPAFSFPKQLDHNTLPNSITTTFKQFAAELGCNKIRGGKAPP